MKKAGGVLATVVGACAALPLFSSPAAAAPSPGASAAPAVSSAADLQARIDATLRRAPGGRQIGRNEIAWRDGRVIMVFPLPGRRDAPPTSAAALRLRGAMAADLAAGTVTDARQVAVDWKGCPSGSTTKYACFYEHANWGGRRLQFADCGNQSLWDYGFGDTTTSWVNTSGSRPRVYNWWSSGTGSTLLWSEAPGTMSANVGSSLNDRADWFNKCG